MHSADRAVVAATRALPSLQHVIIPDASHDLTMRQAALVNDAVTNFLATPTPPPPPPPV